MDWHFDSWIHHKFYSSVVECVIRSHINGTTQVHFHLLRRARLLSCLHWLLEAVTQRTSSSFYGAVTLVTDRMLHMDIFHLCQRSTEHDLPCVFMKGVKHSRTCQRPALVQSHVTTVMDIMLLGIFIHSNKDSLQKQVVSRLIDFLRSMCQVWVSRFS